MKKTYTINIMCVVLITLNLRASITSLGPLASQIIGEYGISEASFGILTSISLVAFGTFSIVAPMFARTKAMFISLILIGIGLFCRSFFGSYMLFVGMGLIGIGIAILNVLLPVFIKSWFKNVGNVMAIYSFSLSASGVIGVLGHYLLGVLNLSFVLFSYIVFVVLALIAFIPHIKNNRLSRSKKSNFLEGFRRVLSIKKAWVITIQVGLQSAFYYTIVSFLPLFMEAKLGEKVAANLMLLAQVMMLPAAYFVPRLYNVVKNQTLYVSIVCLLSVVGFVLIIFFDNLYCMILASFMLGIPMGGVFGMSLLFIAQKTSKDKVAYLSAMAQSFGYLIASVGPFIFGLLKDFSGSYLYGEWLLLVLAIIVLFLTKICSETKSI